MPRLSSFYGIAIYIYYRDHAPPHFHALYGEAEALIAIETADILDGRLPRRARNLVKEWATIHRVELQQSWDLARAGQPLPSIKGLD